LPLRNYLSNKDISSLPDFWELEHFVAAESPQNPAVATDL